MSNYKQGDTQEVNDFLHLVSSGKIKITALDAEALCTELHAVTLDLREFDHMPSSFENLADEWYTARQTCRDIDADEAADLLLQSQGRAL